MNTPIGYWRISALVSVLGCLNATPCPASPATIRHAQSAGDSAAVRAVVARFEDAWNRHDMDAFAALFHEDAAWVHWRGGYWRGRDEIKRGHLVVHQTFYKNTQMQTIAVEKITFLTPVVAVVHDRNNMRRAIAGPSASLSQDHGANEARWSLAHLGWSQHAAA